MAPADLRVTQFSLLGTLLRNGPLKISDLAERQLLDRTALSRNLDPLLERGYVDTVRGRDARTREVTITTKGKAALRAAEPYWKRAQGEVARRIGAQKLDTLIRTLAELEALHPSSLQHPSPQPSPRGAGRGRLPGTALPSPRGAGKRVSSREHERKKA
jgi:DNA-binding MarR family transcriptional regulator